MKKSTFLAHGVLALLLMCPAVQVQSDEVAAGAFGGAATGALIGGAAGGGRGAGIGAGVGLGLGLISGSAAKSRRQRAERQYEAQSVRRRSRQNRNEEYAHEEIMPDNMLTEDDPGYEGSEAVDTTPATSSGNAHATFDTASEDTEYRDEEVMPQGSIETSYEDEI